MKSRTLRLKYDNNDDSSSWITLKNCEHIKVEDGQSISGAIKTQLGGEKKTNSISANKTESASIVKSDKDGKYLKISYGLTAFKTHSKK